jgi:hypothetical protein
MERIKDDFHRRKDGMIDYRYYKALAAEARRLERKRLVLVAIKGGVAFVREAIAAAFRAFSVPGKLGGVRR